MANISRRVTSIRKWLEVNELDAIIIPHEDEYLSEYIPPENERLAWATGFTGSAGIAMISKYTAEIFVDGRYTVQVKQQVDPKIYNILHLVDCPLIKWVEINMSSNSRIGYDPRLHRINWIKDANKELNNKVALVPIIENPVDLLWVKRPIGATNKAILLEDNYTGVSSIKKREQLGKVIENNNCQAAFITQLDSIAWLLNIRGNDVPCNPVLLSHGLLYTDGSFDFFIDNNKIPDDFESHVGPNVNVLSPQNMEEQLTVLSGNNVQLDSNNSNEWSNNIIKNAGAVVINKEDPCILPKACKNSIEINGMKECHIRDAVAVCNFLAWLDEQINSGNLCNEGMLADKLDHFRSKLDYYKGMSFGTISAAGENASMCHYNHKNQKVPANLEMDSVYLVDSGGQYLDGTTDITRTVAIGNPSDFMKKTFTLVLKGHIALGSAQFPEGIAGQHLDTLARQFLWNYGFDYDHGTGHGVGAYLNVHEGPHRIGKGTNNVPLHEGMIVSNEPGYYKENEFGIRCENLILVKQIYENNGKNILGFENLTFVPFDTRLLDISLLTETEKSWINSYHKEVLDKIGPHLDNHTLRWLKNATMSL